MHLVLCIEIRLLTLAWSRGGTVIPECSNISKSPRLLHCRHSDSLVKHCLLEFQHSRVNQKYPKNIAIGTLIALSPRFSFQSNALMFIATKSSII